MNSPKNTSIYLTSKDSNHRLEKISASEISIDSKTELQSIRLHTNNVRQSILGFGGAFTEASASIYDQLDKNKKSEVYVKDDLIEGEYEDKDNENDKKL